LKFLADSGFEPRTFL